MPWSEERDLKQFFKEDSRLWWERARHEDAVL